jgi:hypothetical protein
MKREVKIEVRADGIIIECLIRPIVQRPLQVMTEEQMNTIPEQFRCFSCLDMKDKEEIGGIELGQRLCNQCYPYLDEWWVGTIIKFDLKRKFHVEGE